MNKSSISLPTPAEPVAVKESMATEDSMRTEDTASHSMPNADYHSPVRLGLWVLALGFGGFLVWGALAPLDEGVPAAGVVSVESKRKRVDHLTGGIIEKIAVRDGQQVQEGQQLIVLNEAQAKATLNAAVNQWRITAATESRLRAERDGLKRITFSKELLEKSTDPDVARAMRSQDELFRSRRAALEGELQIIRESVRGLEVQIRNLDQLQVDREKQVKLFQQQLSSYRNLNSQGFVSRNQLLELERQLAEVQSRESETLANIAVSNARLADFRLRAAQREMEYRREVETQLADVQKELATLSETVSAQRDTYSRLVIRAPVAGTVVDLAFHTVGGVIKPGDRIVDIVPEADELIVEARVPTQYIDRVHAGLAADVHFDAYMHKAKRPLVQGSVTVVSADALIDERAGQAYYSMRVSVPSEEVRKLGDLRLHPGMQSTVMVKTGERSLLVYLTRPLLRRFSGAMGEV